MTLSGELRQSAVIRAKIRYLSLKKPLRLWLTTQPEYAFVYHQAENFLQLLSETHIWIVRLYRFLSSIGPTSPVAATHFCPHAAYFLSYFLDRSLSPAVLLYGRTNSSAFTARCCFSWHCHLRNSSLSAVSFGSCPFLNLPRDFFLALLSRRGGKGGQNSLWVLMSLNKCFSQVAVYSTYDGPFNHRLDTSTCSLFRRKV